MKSKLLKFFFIFSLCFSFPVLAQEKLVLPNPIDHSAFSQILKKYISKIGLVDYRSLKRDKEALAVLNGYCEDLSKIDIFVLEPVQERMAALLNLYNALVLREVLKFYPVQNTSQIPHFFEEARYALAGFEKKMSLLDIENLFHERFNDPRHNLARVNASIAGPIFLQEAFNSKNLEKQLEEVTARFINDPSKVSYDARRNVVGTSPLFLWFEEDFKRYSMSLRGFLSSRIPVNLSTKVEFGGYDWRLNDTVYR
ncbi:MAG: DUF547 domain-containing protein [Deltaproteobacteria bacterium]|nr:DUF547 domain-containing protein [Deltaproteobacteria bacterium]